MLPPRRKKPRSGIERGPQRDWPRHEKWVRGHGCSIPHCEDGPIEFAHFRTAANSGTGLKPHSAFGISLCSAHHREQHQIGQPAFEQKYQIDLRKLAAAFTARSPDRAMRESLKLVNADSLN